MNDSRTPTAPGSADPVNGELLHRVQQIRLDDQLGRRKSSGGGATWLPWMLCALLALTWAGVAIRSYRNAPAPGVATGSPPGDGAPAAAGSDETPPPTEATGTIQLEVKGYLMPAQQIAVSPIDVGGRLIEHHVVEGRFYKKGDVLARIDASSYEAARDEAAALLVASKQRQAAAEQQLADLQGNDNPPAGSVRDLEIKQLEAQIREAEAQQRKAEDEVSRLEQVAGARSGREWFLAQVEVAASTARLVKLETDLTLLKKGARPEKIKAAEAELAAAGADVMAAQARLDQAQWRVDNCTIRAPIDGTVLTKKAELGNLVNPMAFSASTSGGGAVCDMADLADIEVDLKIPEREIKLVQVGQPCRIRADAYANRIYTGQVDRIMPIANRSDNTVNVRVKVQLPADEKPGTYLKPEMGAVVSFLPMP